MKAGGHPVSDRLGASAPEGRVVERPRSKVLRVAGGKFGILLVALVALMAFTPLIIEGPVWNVVLTLFTGAVLVASLHAARPGGRPLAFGFALALADFVIGRCAVIFDTRWLVLLQAVLWLSTLIYVTATILEAIFESEAVTVETLQASLCVYLLIGLIGGFGFALIDLTLPGSFQPSHGPGVVWTDERSRSTEFMRLFAFSYATLSGSSYGEIAPATGFASNAASLEAMTGQIYLAVVIARLVGIQAAQAPARQEGRAEETGVRPIEPG
jgi:hypothetical protein